MIRRAWLAVAVMVAAATGAFAQAWERSTEIWIATGQGKIIADAPIWFGANVPAPWGRSTPGIWHRSDLKRFGVPADARAAWLTGMVIITRGTAAETADVRITTRRVGDNATDCTKYLGQAIEAHAGGGQRSGLSLWVPLVNGEFEWCWTATTGGIWPEHSAYGANLVVQAWTR